MLATNDQEVRWLTMMLRPLVRFCVKNSVTIQRVVDVLKVLYVEVATSELEKDTTKINVNRISLTTGVHRRDVATIYRKKQPPPPRLINPLNKVIGLWQNDSRFCARSGGPRVLKFEGTNSFVELVSNVSRHLHPKTVLFELERTKSVEQTKFGIKLLQPILKVGAEVNRRFELLAANMETLSLAALENYEGKNSISNLHIRTEYDNILKSDLPKIRAWFMKEGKAFHRRARKFLSRFDCDVTSGLDSEKGGASIALGSFSLCTTGTTPTQSD